MPGTVYTLNFRPEDDALVLVPLSLRGSGRRILVDKRRRIQVPEEHLRWNLYFVSSDDRGVIVLQPAVALPAVPLRREQA